MGHPWIAVANQGYYRDMRNLGYKTFDHVIDESFDSIENNQDRIERIATVVEDLCQQDLASFLDSCYNVCKYNQERYAEARGEVRAEFPNRFFNFINQHWPQ
jgi:ABC-type transporter MlaC component